MNNDDKILLGHGSGGRLMHDLVSKHLAPAFGISGQSLSDSALLDIPQGARLAFTTDSYVVSPLFFPGGNIGHLAINGTVNDLCMVGAKPLYLTAGFVIEEGLPMATLMEVVSSMASAAKAAGVSVVAGDTKVVERGKADGLFITTAGVGVVPNGVELGPERIEPGDHIIISGPVGLHGVAVMAKRNGLTFDPPVLSDCAPMHEVCTVMLERHGAVRIMRDPTRGGLLTTLKEFALSSGLTMQIWEEHVPVPPGVRGACELLGLDPLYVANEGLVLAVVAPDVSEYLLQQLRALGLAPMACKIGEVGENPKGAVVVHTAVGGKRLADMLQGEQLPRIC